MQEKSGKSSEESQLAGAMFEELHQAIAFLDHERFVVRQELRHVTEYQQKTGWNNISKSDVQDIHTHLSHLLLPQKGDDELARRFDKMMFDFQEAVLSGKETEDYQGKVRWTVNKLAKKDNLPEIHAQISLLEALQSDSYWDALTVIQRS